MAWTDEDYVRLGDYIVAGRVRAGMSRPGLATAAKISARTLADIENGYRGKRKRFDPETLEAISDQIGWLPGSWRRVLDGLEPRLEPADVGAEAEDLPYVAAPGARVEDGEPERDVLRKILAMQEDHQKRLERLEDEGQ